MSKKSDTDKFKKKQVTKSGSLKKIQDSMSTFTEPIEELKV